MRLLLDEMYPATVAEQLRKRGHDVVSVHDADYQYLQGVPDGEWENAAATRASRLSGRHLPHCPGNPSFPVGIRLSEPLGTRTLLGGSVAPPRDATTEP